MTPATSKKKHFFIPCLSSAVLKKFSKSMGSDSQQLSDKITTPYVPLQ